MIRAYRAQHRAAETVSRRAVTELVAFLVLVPALLLVGSLVPGLLWTGPPWVFLGAMLLMGYLFVDGTSRLTEPPTDRKPTA